MLPRSHLLPIFLLSGFIVQTEVGPHVAIGVTIENEVVSASWDAAAHRLAILHKPSNKEFVHDMRFGDIFDAADARLPSIQSVRDKHFGTGQALVFAQTNGNRIQVQTFSRLPFVLICATVHNAGAEPTLTDRLTLADIDVDWGIPTDELMTLGTGGLLRVDEDPGSYAWLAAVEPHSREGIVTGWITHDRGSGIVFSRDLGGKLEIEARLDYGRLIVPPGESAPTETLAIGFFEDARLGLEAWADAIARVYEIQLPDQPSGYCTWYSKPHGGASDEQHIAELSEFAAAHLAPFGFSVVQIDDKWQAGESTNGPNRNFTTHAPQGPYPHGMNAAATAIKQRGLTPGIWFMPFAGTYYDPFFADKQDWFVKHEDGSPYETKWGGTCLDMTYPPAQKYLRSLVERIAGDWGFRYFKLDGLWTGTGTPLLYVNSGYRDDGIGDAVFHDPLKTNIEAFRNGLRLVREAAGPNVFILGCNGPQNMRSYGGSMGLVDAMRIGPDNGPRWQQLQKGPIFGSRHYFLHGRVWYNDPDPVYVRESIPLNHARVICSWVAISGQMDLSSEWLPALPPERLDILKRTMPPHGLPSRPVDLFENDPPRIWSLCDLRRESRRNTIGVFNWDGQPLAISRSFADLGLDASHEYFAFDYWGDRLLGPFSGSLDLNVPDESCRILSLKPVCDRPQLISTSRHVTQGIVDVVEEVWDEDTQTLRGKSRVVGGDAYELRIVLPNERWHIRLTDVANDSNDVTCTATSVQGKLFRTVIHSSVSCVVTWSVKFGHND